MRFMLVAPNRHVIMHLRSPTPMMGLRAVSSSFRFSPHRHHPAPLTVTLRRPTPVTHSSWCSLSKRMFLRSAFPTKPVSNPGPSRDSENAAQTCLHDNEAHSSCLCRQQHKGVNIEHDQGARPPLLDAALTAIMGIGIGELQYWTVRLMLPSYCRMFKSEAVVRLVPKASC